MWPTIAKRRGQVLAEKTSRRTIQAIRSIFERSSSRYLDVSEGPQNEPILDYSSGESSHRIELAKWLREFDRTTIDVPIVIDGENHRTSTVHHQSIPFSHKDKAARFYYADRKLINRAIEVACQAAKSWESTSVDQRATVFEKAAQLVAGKYRAQLNAATMLGQGKTIKQAEIDSAAELTDFLRFNAYYLRCLADWQPRSTEFEINRTKFRGLDGFVAAISPFNFTAIGGNLASAPCLMGNGVVWKPSNGAILSNYIIFKLFQEAGFPEGLINFVPAEGLEFGRALTRSEKLGGVNFTGSLATFQWIWSEVGANIKHYGSFPRLVGECGGKNFHMAHRSANVDVVVAQTIRSAFEYSGQKCSACSRMYVPKSLWCDIKDKLVSATQSLKIGPSDEFGTYTSAVIDATAFKRIVDYISYAKANPTEVQLLCGGDYNDEVGYFVKPTIFQTNNPRNRLMLEEIFGPILCVFVYDDKEIDSVLDLIDENSFALTGSIFARDDKFLERALNRLKMSAGNFYVNDKSTGAVVGQQPFGGSRHSGTNDKAGGPHYLMRWCNQQTVKRTTTDLVEI